MIFGENSDLLDVFFGKNPKGGLGVIDPKKSLQICLYSNRYILVPGESGEAPVEPGEAQVEP